MRSGRQLGDRAVPDATAAGYRRVAGVAARSAGWRASVSRAPAPMGRPGPELAPGPTSPWSRSTGPTARPAVRKGKSDPVDAIRRRPGRAVAAGRPAYRRTATGPVEAIRALRVTRRGAVKARTAAINQLHSLIVTAPSRATRAVLRRPDQGQTGHPLRPRCAPTRPGWPTPNRPPRPRCVGWRAASSTSTAEIARPTPTHDAHHHRRARLCAIRGVGAEVAGQLLVTAGDNPERLRCEAAFAHLCGVAPIPASSGQHRPTPPQPRRRPLGQLRVAYHRVVPHALARTHSRLRRSSTAAGPVQQRASCGVSNASSQGRSIRHSQGSRTPAGRLVSLLAAGRLDPGDQ